MWDVISALGTILSVLVTGIGLLFVARQIADTSRFTKAQFINQLGKDITKHSQTYVKLFPGNSWANDGPGPDKSNDIADIGDYLGVFENLKYLIDTNVIDIDTVDRFFSYRFFVDVQNRHIQEKALYQVGYAEHFSAIFALHQQWTKFRQSRNLDIPWIDSDLANFNPTRYHQLIEVYYRQMGIRNFQSH